MEVTHEEIKQAVERQIATMKWAIGIFVGMFIAAFSASEMVRSSDRHEDAQKVKDVKDEYRQHSIEINRMNGTMIRITEQMNSMASAYATGTQAEEKNRMQRWELINQLIAQQDKEIEQFKNWLARHESIKHERN